MPEISVIIPCFNHGKYIIESVESVRKQTFGDLEIVVVDDGSNDPDTIEILDKLNYPRLKLIHTANNGLPTARNIGIKNSTGRYIFPLDSDDKIAPEYLSKAEKILNSDKDIGIVYCKARLFGSINMDWELPEFDITTMLKKNIIFASAMFRRSDWEKVGGYKKDMIYGYEDYDLWLSIIGLGKKVYQLPETLFYYRKYDKRISMFKKIDYKKRKYSYEMIYNRHKDLYREHIDVLFDEIKSLKNEILKRKEKKMKRLDRRIKNIFRSLLNK